MKLQPLVFGVLIVFSSCKESNISSQEITIKQDTLFNNKQLVLDDSIPVAFHFDYPVGKPDAIGYYNAQPFGENYHLGDDWNAVTGGNSDLGDPIFAIGNGQVVVAKDYSGGWGNVIVIKHRLKNGAIIESLYAHCRRMMVNRNDIVKKGEQIGTIGNVNGLYKAHLHFEIRDSLNMGIGDGYSSNSEGYLNPTAFIKGHR
ncbi:MULTISPECIES: M23 family metallopeptidase [Nonlabens]|uniref:M23 family metallopeptidase n=1 Tax=Nonlabens TaxID=363408 RepID=UPI000CF5451B|nr:M23 family metallopeptidase [Nonlabens tegetincola]PQJ14238.1 hypothetical protein BST93_13425 [Nonlabens tegetincola]